jgi:NADPH:quinone reductase-like Zn-dependent oxidoreductase
MSDNHGVIGVNIGHLWSRADLLLAEMKALLALYEAGKIAPVIDQVLPLERAAEGFDRIASGQNIGKIVVSTSP